MTNSGRMVMWVSTHYDLHSLLPELLDHPLQLPLPPPHVGQQARGPLVAFTTQNFAATSSKAIVETVLGAPLHSGVELGEVRLEVLTLRDIKDDRQGKMSVRHDEGTFCF